MGVNITTIAYLRVLIIEIGSTIILMVVEGQGHFHLVEYPFSATAKWSNGLGLAHQPAGAPMRHVQSTVEPIEPGGHEFAHVKALGGAW